MNMLLYIRNTLNQEYVFSVLGVMHAHGWSN